jgi:archaellum component FlaF (FlaF/FlaG flagellin family)
MGFSVSASMAIFFATFLILFSILYSSVDDAFETVSESFDDRYEYMNERAQTNLDIICLSYSKDTDTFTAEVQNSGSVALDIDKVRLLLDGVLETAATMNISGESTDIWLPMETLTITLDDPSLTFDPEVSVRTHTSSDAGLSNPSNISVGDWVYVLDGTSIDVFTLDGVFDYAISDSANIASPSDLKAYGDYLYVLDEGAHIDRVDLDGDWVDRFVNDTTNTSNPVSFAVDASYIYIVDNFAHIDRYNITTGLFVDQLIANGGTMSAPQDISVGAYIFVIDESSGSYHIDRYALDGTGGVQIVASASLSTPSDISTSGPQLDERYVYVVNNSREIIVLNETGALITSIDSGLSDSVSGVDVTGRIFVSDGTNGLVVENLGTSVKVVTENGISQIAML